MSSSLDKVHLPVEDEFISAVSADGRRHFVHPADVSGRLTRLRYWVFAGLLVVYLLLPWIPINGHPAVFLDVQNRRFYLFGQIFNAQDFWLVFFLLSGVGFVLIVVTTLWGRIWCGYACPQTVFLEAIYRRVERLLEGPRNLRLRRNLGPWDFDKIWRKGIKQILFVLISLFLAHVFLSYFVSLPAVFEMVRKNPANHPEAFAWTFTTAALLYFNFAWFREQLCVVICPYGRLQSVMTDSDTLVIGYDQKRGEPRGKVSADPNVGDCIDCKRCIVVCPTGIDIRNGLQLECIGCAACVDACDEVMTKVGRPVGLIRYDSLHGLAGQITKLFRPRLFLYGALGLIGLAVFSVAIAQRKPFEANVVRIVGAPYIISEGRVRNVFEIHVINKRNDRATFTLVPLNTGELDYELTGKTVTLGSLKSTRVPVIVSVSTERLRRGLAARIQVVCNQDQASSRIIEAAFLGPGI